MNTNQGSMAPGRLPATFLILTACLFIFCLPHALCAESQSESDATEKLRRRIESIRFNERLTVKFHDGSERQGCLKGIEADGFFVGAPEGAAEKIFYRDVDEVKKDKGKALPRVLRAVVRAAATAGVILGAAKIGGNTPKTNVVKVWVGMAGVYAVNAPGDYYPQCVAES